MHQPGTWPIAIGVVAVLAMADLGPLGPASATVAACIWSVLRPHTAPYLLLAVAGVQDAPGQAGEWWYVSTCAVGLLVIARDWHTRSNLQTAPLAHSVMPLLYAASLVVIYAACMSWIYDWTGRFPQSVDRPFAVVAALMVFMMFAGVSAAQSFARDGWGGQRLKAVIAILTIHALAVVAVQAVVGPQFLASELGAESIEGASQLTEATELGYARIRGLYLTPNGFAQFYTLLVLLFTVRQQDRPVELSSVLMFAAVSIGLAAAALSKSMLTFSILTSLAMAAQVVQNSIPSVRTRVLALVMAGLAGIAVIAPVEFDFGILAKAFRFSADDAAEPSYRSQAWSLVIETLDWFSWTLGTGLSHWPVLFEENLTFKLSDPHTYLLSLPGTFGVFGVTLFVVIVVGLGRLAISDRGARRVLAVSLLALFLVKDLVSIPYLLGSTPLTLLIWILLTLVFEVSSRSCGQQLTSSQSNPPAGSHVMGRPA